MAVFDAVGSTRHSRQPSFDEEVDIEISPSPVLTMSAFQLLANKLIHQHFSEVAHLENQLELLRFGGARKESSDDPEKDRSRSTDRSWDKSTEHSQSDQPERSASSNKRLNGLRRKASCLSANKILTVFETDQKEQVEKKFETDFGKLLRANTRYVTDQTSETSQAPAELTWLESFKMWLQSNSYEFAMALLLCINVLFMAMEALIAGLDIGYDLMVITKGRPPVADQWNLSFLIADVIFTALFALDVLVRICVLRRLFFELPMNYIDLAVSITSLVEMTVTELLTLPLSPVLFRLLRIGKLFRAIRMVHMTNMLASLHLLVKCLIASCNMLFWSFCLLTFLQCVAGLVISTLCRGFLQDESVSVELRQEVYLYFGTFSRTILTMFEILFANWGPPCRILVENVNEWFSIFFLFYRCVLGFAVLNVVNAVFVQQTMKTANTDEELAFKQKEKDIALYTRKVKNLFQTMDQSGDGAINLEEFAKLVKSPKLKFWMSQLELEYHDLLSLFEFLDNGDGEITLMEFIEGAARLKGSAKALDIWRLETKIEVLFEHVLRGMRENKDPTEVTNSNSLSIQQVFDQSAFQHIKTTTYSRNRTSEADVDEP